MQGLVDVEYINVHDLEAKQPLFELSNVDTFVAILSSIACVCCDEPFDNIDLSALARVSDQNNGCFGHLLKFIFDSNITIYVTENQSRLKLSDFKVLKADVAQYVEAQFLDVLDDILSETEIRKLCHLDKNEFQLFNQKIKLKALKRRTGKLMYNTEVLKMFFESNVLLNRWAKINNVKLDDIHFYLKNRKYDIADSELEKSGVLIYERSPRLMKLLRQFLYECGYDKGASALFFVPEKSKTFPVNSYTIFL